MVLTGFGEGNTQLRVNGLSWGLDNRIYAANGRSDGEVRMTTERPDEPVSIRRRDVRFCFEPEPEKDVHRPIAFDVEAIAGFSQFGLPHGDWGNRFPSWNTIPIRHVVLEQEALIAIRTWQRPRRSRRSWTCRRRPDLRDQPAAGAVQPRVGRILQRQLRACD